ncbi:hypothetical protein VCRA2119O48_110130 [Vibrio crassostreae]|nr:hypothetical protein VCRA2119O48_110130 [Vibrio crassostreae]CAK3908985.1 hypothetical protein VCRA212O16_330071 [Vibrio crassostreae]
MQQSVLNRHQAFDNFFNPKLKAKYPHSNVDTVSNRAITVLV